MKTSEDSFDAIAPDHEALLGADATSRWRPNPIDRNNKYSIALWVTTTFLTGVVVGLSAVYFTTCSPSYNQCVKQMTESTPLLQDLDIQYNTIPFNGSFMKEDIYRRKASPEVDAAWEALGVDYRPLRIPPEDATLAGLNKDHVQINPKYGGGYPANVEGLHHLHCLNLIRQSTVWDIDYYRAKGKGAFINEDHIVRLHVSHCVDILRQQLMCQADIGVFGQVWYRATPKDEPKAFVDFNTNHKCRNYEDIREWAQARQLPEDAPEDYLQLTEGQRIIAGVP